LFYFRNKQGVGIHVTVMTTKVSGTAVIEEPDISPICSELLYFDKTW